MKKLLLLFAMVVLAGAFSVSAAEQTVTVKGATGTLQDGSTVVFGSSTISYNAKTYLTLVSFADVDNMPAVIEAVPGIGSNTSNSPSYNKDGGLRLYPNNTLEIKAKEGYTLSTLVFSINNVSKYEAPTVTNGEGVYDGNAKTYTWTAASADVTSMQITMSGTSGKQFCFTGITVTYPDGSVDPQPVVLGELTAECNNAAVVSPLVIEEGTPINFHADHATSFEVTVDGAAPVILPADNGSATWTPAVCADANVSVVAKRNVGEDNQESAAPLTFTLTVNKALYTKATWIVTGTTKTDDEYSLKLGEGSSAGVWHLSAGSYYGAINGGAQLGSSNNPFTDGTITLSDSDIPANAIINEITFTGKTNSAYTLAVTVNGQSAGNIEVQTTEQDHTLTGLELAGNEIVFTTNTDATKYLCVKGISVKYTVPEPELDGEPAIQVFHHKDGGFMTVEYSFYVKNYDATQHTIEVLATVEGQQEVEFTEVNAEKAPSRAASESTLFTASLKSNVHEALTGKDKNPTVRVKATVNGGKELFNVTKTDAYDISGIEGVEAEANEGEAVYFNMQGQRVNADQPGLYIRKANGKVSKVVIR